MSAGPEKGAALLEVLIAVAITAMLAAAARFSSRGIAGVLAAAGR